MNARRIRLCFPGMGDDRLFDEHARDNCQEPFLLLRERLRALGYELDCMTGDDLSGVDWLWFWDVTEAARPPSRWRRVAARACGTRPAAPSRSPLLRRARQGHLRDRLVLFLGEPPVVAPDSWDRRLHRDFRVVFTWHDPLVDGRRYVKYRYPLPATFPAAAERPFSQRKLLTAIAGNKRSGEPGELYSAREAAIRFFERAAPDEFDLFGAGWERGDAAGCPFPSYRGGVAHKRDVLPGYRFALCYENQSLEGYVTEKVFDCMRCGVVPVYLGDPGIAATVGPDCFVDRREFADDEQLLACLRTMPEDEFRHRRAAIERYLAGPAFAAHLSPAFADTVVRALALGGGRGTTA